jgi:N-acetylmuramoyl-L-alanine amidase
LVKRDDCVNKIQIVALTALLAGCASAPQLETKPNAPIQVVRVEKVHEVKVQPQPRIQELDIQLPLRKVDAKSQQCLAMALYWEARGEGQHGMLAVSSVVLNRVKDKRFPDTVCDVIYDGGESPPCQFSWWCDGKSDHPTNQAQWTEILELSHDYLATRPADPTDGAVFYHATSIQRPWKRDLTAQIGNHIFYR